MISHRLKILVVQLVLMAPLTVTAQYMDYKRWEDNSFYQEDYRIDTSFRDQFYIRIKNTNFFKNNEYANEFKIGSSLTGLFLEPTIDYYAGTRTRIRAGMHFLKYYGQDNIERAAPVLSVQHSLNGNIDMVFGTIYGSANHGLIEPVFNFEKYLIDNYENGLQLLMNYNNFKTDLWLNWEQFIKAGDPFQEKFTAGLNTVFSLYRTDLYELEVPFMAMFRHKGGQIDSSPLPAGTQSNFLQGIRLRLLMSEGFLKKMVLEQSFVQFIEVNHGPQIEIPDGYGSFSRIKLDTRIGNFSLAYWRSFDFEAPHGEGLFLSKSEYDMDFYMPNRRVVSIKYQYQYRITDFLNFALRIEPYYHLHSGRLDNSFGVLLLVDKDFFMARALPGLDAP